MVGRYTYVTGNAWAPSALKHNTTAIVTTAIRTSVFGGPVMGGCFSKGGGGLAKQFP